MAEPNEKPTEARMDAMEERLDRLSASVESLESRVGHLYSLFHSLSDSIVPLREAMHKPINRFLKIMHALKAALDEE